MTSRKTTIPPLLEPYLRLPSEASLLLLTGVLNATPHWLTTRALRGAYDSSAGDGNQDVAVVLVSWLRDYDFWKAEARRGAGLDLGRLAQENKFAFVDGLSSLFSAPLTPPSTPPGGAQLPTRPLQPTSPGAQRAGGIPNRTPPARGGPIPPRGAAPPPTQQQPAPAQQPPPPQQQQQQKNKYTLTSPTLPHAQQTITTAINTLTSSGKKILLILDSPTTPLLLDPTLAATSLSHLVLALRANVHAAIVSLESDLPFLAPATASLQQSRHEDHAGPGMLSYKAPLETEMSRFIVGQAHAARWVVGVRGLDTGVARDVSGVVRVSRGGDAGGWDDEEEEDGGNGNNKRERDRDMEVLYFVQGDGGVRVFERGGGNIG